MMFSYGLGTLRHPPNCPSVNISCFLESFSVLAQLGMEANTIGKFHFDPSSSF